MLMFIAALFTIANRWKQLKYPSMNEWIYKICYIHSREYYLALKMIEIVSHALTCMNLKDIMLSERSRARTEKYRIIPLI